MLQQKFQPQIWIYGHSFQKEKYNIQSKSPSRTYIWIKYFEPSHPMYCGKFIYPSTLHPRFKQFLGVYVLGIWFTASIKPSTTQLILFLSLTTITQHCTQSLFFILQSHTTKTQATLCISERQWMGSVLTSQHKHGGPPGNPTSSDIDYWPLFPRTLSPFSPYILNPSYCLIVRKLQISLQREIQHFHIFRLWPGIIGSKNLHLSYWRSSIKNLAQRGDLWFPGILCPPNLGDSQPE